MTNARISPEARLDELGIELPVPPTLPFAARLKPVVVHGGLVYLSGNGDLAASAGSGTTWTSSGRRSRRGRPRT